MSTAEERMQEVERQARAYSSALRMRPMNVRYVDRRRRLWERAVLDYTDPFRTKTYA